jgi:serine/threonine-protein kinase RsbW
MKDLDTICIDLPASYKYLHVLGTCISEMLVRVEGLKERDTTTYSIQVAVQEACTNIVDHAYKDCPPGRINVTLALDSRTSCLVVELQDTGQAFDYTNMAAHLTIVQHPDSQAFDITSVLLPQADDFQERGRGLFLMCSLMDKVTCYPETGNNRWHMVKRLV